MRRTMKPLAFLFSVACVFFFVASLPATAGDDFNWEVRLMPPLENNRARPEFFFLVNNRALDGRSSLYRALATSETFGGGRANVCMPSRLKERHPERRLIERGLNIVVLETFEQDIEIIEATAGRTRFCDIIIMDRDFERFAWSAREPNSPMQGAWLYMDYRDSGIPFPVVHLPPLAEMQLNSSAEALTSREAVWDACSQLRGKDYLSCLCVARKSSALGVVSDPYEFVRSAQRPDAGCTNWDAIAYGATDWCRDYLSNLQRDTPTAKAIDICSCSRREAISLYKSMGYQEDYDPDRRGSDTLRYVAYQKCELRARLQNPKHGN